MYNRIKIIIQDLEVYAFHGCKQSERNTGGQYLVSVILHCNIGNCIETDNLEDTVDYGKVIDLIRNEMQIPSNLIEHVAGRIQKKILQTFDKVSKVEVVVKKKILPLDASLNYVAVEIS